MLYLSNSDFHLFSSPFPFLTSFAYFPSLIFDCLLSFCCSLSIAFHFSTILSSHSLSLCLLSLILHHYLPSNKSKFFRNGGTLGSWEKTKEYRRSYKDWSTQPLKCIFEDWREVKGQKKVSLLFNSIFFFFGWKLQH